MNAEENPIQSVLIQCPVASGAARRVLGRFLGERQVEFAAELGAKQAIVIGGGTAEAIAVRHRAEQLGLRYREISGPHALANSMDDAGMLLVLGEDLLPTPEALPENSIAGSQIIILPADAGYEAGFERIDLARAWAGALTIEGRYLSGLLELPEDSEAAPAILRLALQARLPEIRISGEALADGRWTMMRDSDDLPLVEERWLARLIRPTQDAPWSRQLVARVLKRFGARLCGNERWPNCFLFGGILTALGSVGLAWFGMGWAAFTVIALCAILLELYRNINGLSCIPAPPSKVLSRAPWLADLSILACGVLSIDGDWYRMAFPPLMLVAVLHIARSGQPNWLARLRDIPLIALFVSAVGWVWSLEVGIMLSAALLALFSLPIWAKAPQLDATRLTRT